MFRKARSLLTVLAILSSTVIFSGTAELFLGDWRV
nr:MAG TPA: hypothetical protein [Caudoviricetes sp.]